MGEHRLGAGAAGHPGRLLGDPAQRRRDHVGDRHLPVAEQHRARVDLPLGVRLEPGRVGLGCGDRVGARQQRAAGLGVDGGLQQRRAVEGQGAHPAVRAFEDRHRVRGAVVDREPPSVHDGPCYRLLCPAAALVPVAVTRAQSAPTPAKGTQRQITRGRLRCPDNVHFGLRAIGCDGRRSAVAHPNPRPNPVLAPRRHASVVAECHQPNAQCHAGAICGPLHGMAEVLQVVGAVAGIGGLGLGVVLLVYRDFVRQLVRRRAFRTLSSSQATTLFAAVVILTFAVAVVGVFAGLVADAGPVTFLILVGLLLCFAVVVLVLIGPHREPRTVAATDAASEAGDIERLIDRGSLDAAEHELARLFRAGHEEAPVWYWRARIAAARGNLPVAIAYADEALKREPQYVPGAALKIRLLILSPRRGDRERARQLADSMRGVDRALDGWLDCLRAGNQFRPGVTTAAELDGTCPMPARLSAPQPTNPSR
ncbi:type IV pilus biogenesis/stability protein PilW [Dactylosporangium sp. NPDC048998]|uniref:tetratricopeptide repeat protein n=1 Tax=Dactylosporangium sp. NPDC048998 TaxID=3363976 RepID=UPI0037180BDD